MPVQDLKCRDGLEASEVPRHLWKPDIVVTRRPVVPFF